MFQKHWRLNLLGLVFIAIFFLLSYWQCSRAKEKTLLGEQFKARQTMILTTQKFFALKDPLFYSLRLKGEFDHAHTILLDNKTFKGKIGYEVYTPFRISNSNTAILVDRGFVPITGTRSDQPAISHPNETEIIGYINPPPTYYKKGNMINDDKLKPLIRVEFLDLNAVSKLIGYSLSSYVLILRTNENGAPPQLTIMPAEKHRAYALQWFALGATLLVLLVALNLRKAT